MSVLRPHWQSSAPNEMPTTVGDQNVEVYVLTAFIFCCAKEARTDLRT